MSNKKRSAMQSITKLTWENGTVSQGHDEVADETPVALIYNCLSYAVMMVSPQDLEDFALGFSLSENIIQQANEMLDIEVANDPLGMVVSMIIPASNLAEIKDKQRAISGRTGCGICGTQTLQEIMPDGKKVRSKVVINHTAIETTVNEISAYQPLNKITGAVHAAAWCDLNGTPRMVREDVGRHNALDKLIGAMTSAVVNTDTGFLFITSRASYEMVTKAASAGIAIVAAVSAPTSLAIDKAQLLGITLLGFSRKGRHVIYTHPQRVE